ncbi:UNVERIFIED_CONTAM: Cyp3a2 [Trichonephila clavipes]
MNDSVSKFGILLERQAETDCKLGDSGITVPKGMIITIPNYALHHDPKLFKNPEKFDPDRNIYLFPYPRFTSEERAKRDPNAYLPFGAGPRNCVGMRFALMEIKICLAYVVTNFEFFKCSETQVTTSICRRQLCFRALRVPSWSRSFDSQGNSSQTKEERRQNTAEMKVDLKLHWGSKRSHRDSENSYKLKAEI